MRIEFPTHVQRAAAKRANGICEGCKLPLRSGAAHFDHINPDYFSKDATLENCQVLCPPCHREKTFGQDIPAIAKAKRINDKHHGIGKRKYRWGYGSDDPRKKKIGGKVVPRTPHPTADPTGFNNLDSES